MDKNWELTARRTNFGKKHFLKTLQEENGKSLFYFIPRNHERPHNEKRIFQGDAAMKKPCLKYPFKYFDIIFRPLIKKNAINGRVFFSTNMRNTRPLTAPS